MNTKAAAPVAAGRAHMGSPSASPRADSRLRVRALAAAALALTPALGRVAWAQEGAAIELSGELELARLVELVTQRLGVSVQYQAPDLNKKVTLRLRSAPTDAELWDVLLATLESQGLSLVGAEQENLFRIVPAAQAPAQDARLMLPDGAAATQPAEAPFRAGHQSVVVRLRSADPAEVIAALTPLLTPQTGLLKPIGAGGLLLVSDSARKVEQALSVLELLDGPPDPVRVVTVELQHAGATEVVALAAEVLGAKSGADPRHARGAAGVAMAPSAAPGGAARGSPRLIALSDERRILIITPGSREAEVRSLIGELDVREAVETRAYSVPSASPEELAASIRTMLDSGPAGGAPGPGARGAGGRSGGVVADRLLGAALVTASARDHQRVAQLVELVRSTPAASRQTLRAFTIKSRSARELADTLESLLQSGAFEASRAAETPAGGASDAGQLTPNRTGLSDSGVFTVPGSRPTAPPLADSGAESATGGERSRAEASRANLTLSVDEATNTILAIGEPSMLGQLEAIIAELDKRQPQVLIEASLVSLSESEALNFGVELSGQFEVGGSSVNLASLFGLGGATSGGGPLAAGTGFTGTVINPGDFQVIVRALENINRGRAVSSPKALVNNNSTATLRGVNRQPFTSINASQTVATTSFGGTQDAGTTITVTPSIAAGDHLVLDYAVELSAFTGEPTTTAGGGIIPPPSQQNSVEGSATIPDGFTVVIGGLDNASASRGQSRVPLLGRIPILGALFGTTSESDLSSRFFVFIRATVLRHGGFEDLKRLSAPDLAAAQVSDGTPVLEPLWVE